MGSSDARASREARRGPTGPAFELTESKLRPPPIRSGMVDRQELVQRLLEADDQSVLAVVAPPGYGKSTLLAEWARRRGPRVGWFSADDRDNDPAVLLTYLAAAVSRIEPVDPRLYRMLTSPGGGIASVPLLVSALDGSDEPVALVVDHAEAITNPACRDVIAELAVCLPVGSQLAIGSRHEIPVPVARLRAERAIVEIGIDDLAMDAREAAQLLGRAGVDLAESEVRGLHERTEGWPVGLYLAALAIQAGGSHTDAALTITGDDRFIGDYLRTELLGRASRADVSFLTRTASLDELDAPLCDATVGRRGSGGVLHRLEEHNLLLIPVDRRRRSYRYHHLFRELLYDELQRREPDMVPVLHGRAAAWFEAHGEPELAIRHAQLAGDGDGAARLVLGQINPAWASGRSATIMTWLEWFAARGLVENHPAVAVHGALMYALAGDAGEADRWAAAAERTTATGALPDGNTVEASVAYLRALLCRHGLDEMRRDAELALGGLGPSSPYRLAMLHALGVSHLLQGELDLADGHFVSALHQAVSTGVAPFVPVLLAERGIVAIEREDWPGAQKLAEAALDAMDGGQLDDYWTSALVYAWAARTAAARGAVVDATDLAQRAARLRPLLTHALPVVAVQALLELTRAFIALGDPGGAHATLEQIGDICRRRPRLGRLVDQAEAERARLGLLRGEMLGVTSLTPAELRLLHLLPTHLSFAEIGERFFISRHTVKTQAASIYRKIGASSRSEAVDRLGDLGLHTPI